MPQRNSVRVGSIGGWFGHEELRSIIQIYRNHFKITVQSSITVVSRMTQSPYPLTQLLHALLHALVGIK